MAITSFVKDFFDCFPELEYMTEERFNSLYEWEVEDLAERISDFLYKHIMEINPRQRLEIFVNVFVGENTKLKIPDKIAANMIAYDFWTSSDIGKSDWKTKNRILDLLKLADRSKNEWYKTTYDKLPTEVILYRGARGRKNSKGIYWTLDKKKAEFFALQYARPGYLLPDINTKAWVYTAIIKKPNIIFMTNDRKEEEIVCHPKDIEITKCEKVRLENGFGSKIIYESEVE